VLLACVQTRVRGLSFENGVDGGPRQADLTVLPLAGTIPENISLPPPEPGRGGGSRDPSGALASYNLGESGCPVLGITCLRSSFPFEHNMDGGPWQADLMVLPLADQSHTTPSPLRGTGRGGGSSSMNELVRCCRQSRHVASNVLAPAAK
jgi:hypothetical protein